jgi:hypothetical protein
MNVELYHTNTDLSVKDDLIDKARRTVMHRVNF